MVCLKPRRLAAMRAFHHQVSFIRCRNCEKGKEERPWCITNLTDFCVGTHQHWRWWGGDFRTANFMYRPTCNWQLVPVCQFVAMVSYSVAGSFSQLTELDIQRAVLRQVLVVSFVTDSMILWRKLEVNFKCIWNFSCTGQDGISDSYSRCSKRDIEQKKRNHGSTP